MMLTRAMVKMAAVCIAAAAGFRAMANDGAAKTSQDQDGAAADAEAALQANDAEANDAGAKVEANDEAGNAEARVTRRRRSADCYDERWDHRRRRTDRRRCTGPIDGTTMHRTEVKAISDGTYTFRQKVNNRYLDAHQTGYYSAVTRAGDAHSRHWLIKSVGANLYTVQQKVNNRCLDAYQEEDFADYSAVTRGCHNGDRQKWLIKSVGENLYTVQQKVNNRYLDAHQTSNDYSAVTREASNLDNQKWLIVEASVCETETGYRCGSATQSVCGTGRCCSNFGWCVGCPGLPRWSNNYGNACS